jgi:hypothetical protein
MAHTILKSIGITNNCWIVIIFNLVTGHTDLHNCADLYFQSVSKLLSKLNKTVDSHYLMRLGENLVKASMNIEPFLLIFRGNFPSGCELSIEELRR